MADPKKISELDPSVELLGGELIPIVQNGVNKSATTKKLLAATDYVPKVFLCSIPAIDANTRQVVQVDMGILNNINQQFIQFLKPTVADGQILEGAANVMEIQYVGADQYAGELTYIQPIKYVYAARNSLLVFSDYTKTRRLTIPIPNTEKINLVPDTLPNTAMSYNGLASGALIGYYTVGGARLGAFQLDKYIVLESAWLSQSGANTILNIALKNFDVNPNTPATFKALIYD